MADTEQKEIAVEEIVPEVVAEEVVPDAVVVPEVVPGKVPARGGRDGRRSGGRDGRRGGGRGPGGRGARTERKSEYDQRLINIRRVARVVAGGRGFSFSGFIILGDKKGKVGVGVGKAGDTTLAIDKAVRDAKKHIIKVNLTKNNSIAHDVSSKFCASRVMLIPAPGRGLVAGSSARPVLELAGITNIIAKIHSGSKNGLNNARATIEALKALKA